MSSGVTIYSFRGCNIHKRVDIPRGLKIQPTNLSPPTRKEYILKLDNRHLRGCLYPERARYYICTKTPYGMAEAVKTGLFGFAHKYGKGICQRKNNPSMVSNWQHLGGSPGADGEEWRLTQVLDWGETATSVWVSGQLASSSCFQHWEWGEATGLRLESRWRWLSWRALMQQLLAPLKPGTERG